MLFLCRLRVRIKKMLLRKNKKKIPLRKNKKDKGAHLLKKWLYSLLLLILFYLDCCLWTY